MGGMKSVFEACDTLNALIGVDGLHVLRHVHILKAKRLKLNFKKLAEMTYFERTVKCPPLIEIRFCGRDEKIRKLEGI